VKRPVKKPSFNGWPNEPTTPAARIKIVERGDCWAIAPKCLKVIEFAQKVPAKMHNFLTAALD
jgi:hypothetical protein